LSRRYRFVSHYSSPDLPAEQRHPVTRLREAVGAGRGGFYAWRAAEPARAVKASAEQALTCRIRKIHQASRCTYGAKRVALDLADGTDGGHPARVNHKKVARLMRQHQIAGRHLRRRRSLTRQDGTAAPAPDLLGRDFAAEAPDVKWCGDITYIPVGESGFIYLATVIDLFSGRLLGWSIADHHRADLVADALKGRSRRPQRRRRRRDLPLRPRVGIHLCTRRRLLPRPGHTPDHGPSGLVL